MNDYFDRLFRFNNWANHIVGRFLTDHQIDDHECIKLMSHLLAAQSNWYKRITDQQDDEPIWQILDLDQVTARLGTSGELWRVYVKALSAHDFSDLKAYNNMAGKPMQNTVQDLLAHVVNHATHHRGQVVRRIRELGFTPPPTDYVLFAREFPPER